MPLSLAALQSGIQNVCASPAETAAGCADQWAQAMGDYAEALVPASATVSAARATLASSLAAAFVTSFAAPGMDSAFAAFAATVGAGQVGFVPVPPPRPVGFAALLATLQPTHNSAAAAVAGLIDSWMRSGSSTPVAGGPPVPWT